MLSRKLLDRFLVSPGEKIRLQAIPTTFRGFKELAGLRTEVLKDRAQRVLRESLEELARAQERLWANDTHAVLVVLQGMDTSGKDGIIKHVMSGVNPQGVSVSSFKRPSEEELDHTFLWRVFQRTPERGRIGIFNRSHYEDVIVSRVHPEILERVKLPSEKRGKKLWKERYEDINAFERHLHRNGTVVVKFYLHLSKEEQRKRLLARLEDPKKHWKFQLGDLAERKHWDRYLDAYQKALRATSTEWAPWHVVPADEKWAARAIVGFILTSTILSLGLEYPEVSDEERKNLAEAKQELEAETGAS